MAGGAAEARRSLTPDGRAHALPFDLFDRVRVAPKDGWLHDAIAFGAGHPFDATVAVGGGSTIDTATAVTLDTTCPPAELLDYVNRPIGKGLPVTQLSPRPAGPEEPSRLFEAALRAW